MTNKNFEKFEVERDDEKIYFHPQNKNKRFIMKKCEFVFMIIKIFILIFISGGLIYAYYNGGFSFLNNNKIQENTLNTTDIEFIPYSVNEHSFEKVYNLSMIISDLKIKLDKEVSNGKTCEKQLFNQSANLIEKDKIIEFLKNESLDIITKNENILSKCKEQNLLYKKNINEKNIEKNKNLIKEQEIIIEDQKKNIIILKNEIDDKSKMLVNMEEILNNKTLEFDKQTEEHIKNHTKLSNDIEKQKQTIASLEIDMSYYMNKHNNISKEIDDKNKILNILNNKILELENSNKLITGEFENLTNSIKFLKNQLIEKEHSRSKIINEITEKLNIQDVENNSLTEKNLELENIIKNLRDKIEKLEINCPKQDYVANNTEIDGISTISTDVNNTNWFF